MDHLDVGAELMAILKEHYSKPLKEENGYTILPVTFTGKAATESKSSPMTIDLGKLAEDPDGFLRKQLCLLVNERVPSHLLGAPIRTVDSSPSRACIEVHVTGASDPFRIAAARLWEHGLTVDKCVEMFHGKIRAQMPDNPDEAIAAGWTWHPVVGWQAP